jgi:PleD family two-component response regulator
MDDLVLIADDDRDIVRFVEVNLHLEGFRVETANDGDEALAKALQLEPDLILLDVMMPNMDGFEVCRRLRAESRTSGTPVIMLTAKSLSADKTLGMRTGADDYIVKPFDPMELVHRVKTTLKRAKELQAVSSVTGLPGAARIELEVQQRLDTGAASVVGCSAIDGLDPFTGRYGEGRGDEVLAMTARIFRQAVESATRGDGFVGHVGKDSFVFIVPPDRAEDVANRVIAGFDTRVPTFYDEVDTAAGGIEVPGPNGGVGRLPVMTISLGAVTVTRQRFASYRDVAAAASDRRKAAREEPGSTFVLG